jgi:hypothetical protein
MDIGDAKQARILFLKRGGEPNKMQPSEEEQFQKALSRTGSREKLVDKNGLLEQLIQIALQGTM